MIWLVTSAAESPSLKDWAQLIPLSALTLFFLALLLWGAYGFVRLLIPDFRRLLFGLFVTFAPRWIVERYLEYKARKILHHPDRKGCWGKVKVKVTRDKEGGSRG